MEAQTLWSGLLTVAVGVAGWFLRMLFDTIQSLRAELSAHKVEVAKDYVTHDDLDDIKQILSRIEDKLDKKADK